MPDIDRKHPSNLYPWKLFGNPGTMEHCSTVTGVDSGDKNLDTEAMRQYAGKYHLLLIASGEKDIITDGTAIYICENGDAKMAKITGSGCMSSVMLGAFLGTEPSVQSAAASCAFVGIAGELASEKTDACGGGTMTFRNLFIDQVSLMTQEKMSRCRVHI